MTDRRSVVHSTFTLERKYPSSPSAVFGAWADRNSKISWFAGNEEDYDLDFRPGGIETNRAVHDGTRLVLTEAGAYLDGRELPEWREEGTADWLDRLGRHLVEVLL